MSSNIPEKIRRTVDICVGSGGTVLVKAITPLVSIAIKRSMGEGPVIYEQTRFGLHGEPFKILKFRSMSNATDADGNLLPDEQRLNRLGRFMRRFSIDELPQLINIRKGDMSLVGPRPYVPRMPEEFRARNNVRHGLTGAAQVFGQRESNPEGHLTPQLKRNLEIDLQYVRERENMPYRRLLRDVWVVAATPVAIMRGKGTNPAPVTVQTEIKLMNPDFDPAHEPAETEKRETLQNPSQDSRTDLTVEIG